MGLQMYDFGAVDAQSLIDRLYAYQDLTDEDLRNAPDLKADIITYAHDGDPTGHVAVDAALVALADYREKEGITPEIVSGGLLGGALSKIGAMLGRALEGVGNAFARAFRNVFGQITDVFKRDKDERIAAESKRMLDKFVDKGIIDGGAAEKLNELLDWDGAGRNLMPIVLSGVLGVGAIKTIFNTAGGDFGKQMMKIFTPAAPETGQLLRLAFLDGASRKVIKNKLAENGFSAEDIRLMLRASMQTLPVDLLATLYLRDDIEAGEAIDGLYKLGFNKVRATQIFNSWKFYPSVQDIMYLAGREAFEPDIIEHYGYGSEFPSDMLPFLRAQGMDEEMGRAFWHAHWNPPSISQGYEMLWRDQIDLDELNDLFKTVETPPFWRDKLTAIAYRPYTRVDTRRMYKAGILTADQVYENYLYLGYDEEHAENMTLWTIQEEADESRGLTRAQLLGYYGDGRMPADELKARLVLIGYSEADADLMISDVDYDNDKKNEDERIDTIKDMFTSQRLDRDEARGQLMLLDLPAASVTNMLERWELLIGAKVKFPSKADLDKFVKGGVINVDTWKDEMRRLTYPEKYIEMYLGYLIRTSARVWNEVNPGQAFEPERDIITEDLGLPPSG